MGKNKDNSKKILRIGIMVGSVLLSALVTIVSSIRLSSENIQIDADSTISLDSINIGISLILGCLTFIIFELIALVFSSISYTKQKIEDEKFMDNISEYSHYLHDINGFYYSINKESHGDNDLFVTYAKKEIEKLHNVLGKAATQKEFSISSDYIINAGGVFDAFSQTTEKILKMTFPVMNGETIFTSAADIHFFEVLKSKVASKEVNAVNVIVILEDIQLESDSKVTKLLDFFKATQNYNCKIALLNDFRAVCETNGISSQFVDFGIYGPKMLYIAEQYVPIHKGTYYKEENRIRHYTRLFDEVWESDTITHQNPSTNTTPVELAELITPDAP